LNIHNSGFCNAFFYLNFLNIFSTERKPGVAMSSKKSAGSVESGEDSDDDDDVIGPAAPPPGAALKEQ
jgi:hypothetical protein